MNGDNGTVVLDGNYFRSNESSYTDGEEIEIEFDKT